MITAFYAAILVLLFVVLSVNVVRLRKRLHVGLGDNGSSDLQRAVRAQANFTEYTPLLLIVLGLAEQHGSSPYLLHICGIVFLLGRLSHAYSLLINERYEGTRLMAGYQYRVAGMMCTFGTLVVLAVVLLLLITSSLFT